MFRKCTLAVLLAAACGMGSVNGQETTPSDRYGEGVHLLFARDYQGAYDQFSSALDSGMKDPRVFYFRGLTLLASGRSEAAIADWKKGAEIEANGTYGGIVGRSLARVQGPVRIRLEQIRSQARMEAAAKRAAINQARYNPPANSPIALAGATEVVVPNAPANPFATGVLVAGSGAVKVDQDNSLANALKDAQPASVDTATAGGAGATGAAGAPTFEENTGFDDTSGFGDPAPASDDPFGF